jgi:hypothetical protein
MRAVLVEAIGSPPVVAEVDAPVREPGSALVAVAAAPPPARPAPPRGRPSLRTFRASRARAP